MNTRESAALESVEVTTGPEPSAAVVWLHGLGADGHDFEPLVPQLLWPQAPDIRFVFPHAPVRPVTVNGGMAMRAWYDIVSLDSDRDADRAGIMQSIAQATALVDRERERGIESQRIVVAGFSQGGAIATHVALRYPHGLAGLIALSTYLLLERELDQHFSAANKELPVFAGHGTYDPMVPMPLGQMLEQKLSGMGLPVDWHNYPMPHAVCPEEIEQLAAWLRRRLV